MSVSSINTTRISGPANPGPRNLGRSDPKPFRWTKSADDILASAPPPSHCTTDRASFASAVGACYPIDTAIPSTEIASGQAYGRQPDTALTGSASRPAAATHRIRPDSCERARNIGMRRSSSAFATCRRRHSTLRHAGGADHACAAANVFASLGIETTMRSDLTARSATKRG